MSEIGQAFLLSDKIDRKQNTELCEITEKNKKKARKNGLFSILADRVGFEHSALFIKRLIYGLLQAAIGIALAFTLLFLLRASLLAEV